MTPLPNKLPDGRLANRLLGLLLATTVVATSLPSVAAASQWRSYSHASACKAFNGIPMDTGWIVYNDSSVSAMTMLCPLPNSTDYKLRYPDYFLYFNAWDGNSSSDVEFMVCVSYYSRAGGACTTHQRVGPTNSQPTGSVFTGNNFSSCADCPASGRLPYLWIRLPQKQGSSRSGLRGYYAGGNQ